jgi:hypothetical protein
VVSTTGKRIHVFKNTTKDEKMVRLKELLQWVIHPIRSYKEQQAYKKRIEELRKRDPFIYK